MRLFNDWMRRPTALGVLLPILTLVATGCNSVLDTSQDYADKARVVVTGTSPGPLKLVTSTNWVPVTNTDTGEIINIVIDSTVYDITLPVDTAFKFTNSRRFLVRVVNVDTTQTADLRMRVYLDSKQVTDQATQIKTAPLQFSWRYF
jgi:hypothetical protein